MDLRRHCGFSVIELIVTVAVIATVTAVSVPSVLTGMRMLQVNGAARSVQSELQAARLKAVSANRPMRVRFNCPAANQFRMVELIGTPAAPDARDSAGDRCSQTAYPYPAADRSVLTRPNHDGPVRFLPRDVTFTSSQTIEFWADGTAHGDAGSGNPWPALAPTGVTLTVKYKTSTKSITVNGVGKVHIQ